MFSWSMRLITIFISRALTKFFLFIALSVGTPAVNAMWSLEERQAIVIVINTTRKSRERGLIRAFGYKPEYKFAAYV